jgi:hypothetical protein
MATFKDALVQPSTICDMLLVDYSIHRSATNFAEDEWIKSLF